MQAIFNRTNDDVHSWKAQMHVYQKNKRTKKPFGKSLPQIERVTSEQVKERQTLFHPILQTYKRSQDQQVRNYREQAGRAKSLMKHLKNTVKYEKNFDIVNLYGADDSDLNKINKKLGPVRNIHNIINNQKLSDVYFKNRQLKLPIQKHMKVLSKPPRQYDLISGNYRQNHQQKTQEQMRNRDQNILDRYWRTHDYDPVFGKFYDQGKQQNYQQEVKERAKQHGKDLDKKLPPSYIQRQGFVFDFNKPLPENLKTLDEKKQNAKKRFKVKYIVQDEYSKRNEEWDNKKEEIVHNKVHNGRVQQLKGKQFDIVNNKHYQADRAQKLFNKKTVASTWDKLNKEAAYSTQPGKIKSSGFGSQL